MHEIGIAQALRRHIVLATSAGAIPSNLSGLIYVSYSLSNLRGLARDLATQLGKILPSVLARRSQFGTTQGGRSYYREIDPPPRPDIPTDAVELRDVAEAAKKCGDTQKAVANLEKALSIFSEYWEAKYDLALALSLLKHEQDALRLANEVIASAGAARDHLHVCRAHNLKSGIFKRGGDHIAALAEARKAYAVAHSDGLLANGHALIVPTKNRLVLELLVGDEHVAQVLKQEILRHPRVRDIRDDLEGEIGPLE